MEISDAAVVAQVLAGDKDAFRLLVDRHTRNVYSVAFRMTGNQQDAEEIVQDSFLRAYKSLQRFELRSSFSTWLYRIAVNRSLDFLRARRPNETRQAVDNPAPHEDGGESQVQVVASGDKIARAMTQLSPPERAAFTMRHLEGKSIAEISKALKIRESAAKNSVFRAVQKLRQQLEPLMSTAK